MKRPWPEGEGLRFLAKRCWGSLGAACRHPVSAIIDNRHWDSVMRISATLSGIFAPVAMRATISHHGPNGLRITPSRNCLPNSDQAWMAKGTHWSQNLENSPTTPSFSLIDLTPALRMCASLCVVTLPICSVDTGSSGDSFLKSGY